MNNLLTFTAEVVMPLLFWACLFGLAGVLALEFFGAWILRRFEEGEGYSGGAVQGCGRIFLHPPRPEPTEEPEWLVIPGGKA